LDPLKSWSYEVGFRGNPEPWLTWDTSLFLVDLDNKFGGTVVAGGVTSLRNVGRTVNRGWDAAVQFDLVGALDNWRGTENASSFGSFDLYGNVMLLDAEIRGGTFGGMTPQYANRRHLPLATAPETGLSGHVCGGSFCHGRRKPF
jgi:outer membrane receptor protein involved in Fe transport